MNFIKRSLALALCLCMILTTGVVAFATGNVAKIGENEYATLAEAISAATNGQTVTLISDTQLDEMITIPSDKNIILDLNGKAITVTKSGDRSLYAFYNEGTLTLNDTVGTGSITARGNYNYGTMVMNGGTVVACDTNGGYGIWNYGDFTMNGGTIKVTHVGSYSDQYGPTGLGNESGATALITGGEFDGKNARAYIIASSGNLTITPAAGKTVTVYAPRGVAINGGTAVINGGIFEVYDANEVEGTHVAAETYYSLYIGSSSATVTVNGGDFNAPEQSVWNEKEGNVSIYGGSFNTSMSGKNEVHGNKKITIYGGTYVELPEKYLAADVATASLTASGATDASKFAVGAASIKELSEEATTGAVLTITAVGNETIEVVAGTQVKNGTGATITVNGKEIAAGTTETTPEQPKPETKPTPCDHKLDANGKCERCGVIIISYENGKPSVSDKIENEANPNTGAESVIGVVAAVAALSLAGAVIAKRK